MYRSWMRFSYADSMVDPSFYVPLAQAAEDAGYTSMIIPDSICYPEESDSTYPYTPDGSREFLEDKPFIDPFVLISHLAAVTTRLRFTTFVVKLPVRHPVLMAKQASSTAVLSGNRLGLGVGTSPWPEDYEVTDTPWERRGQRMDECIEIIQGLCSGGYHSHHGEIFDLQSIKISPVPSEPIPILIGGHGPRALERAALLGDGWMHAGGGDERLEDMIATLHRLREDHGTSNRPFEIHAISMDGFSVDGVKRLEALGVTDVIVGFRWVYEAGPDTEPLQKKIDDLRRFADEVVTKV
jgi:probable F420-dependent oxidoreductase